MGRPDIHNFEVIVEYNSDNSPAAAKYWDQEGCGHESEIMDLNLPIRHFVNYHVMHCAKHEVYPKAMCQYVLRDDKGKHYKCILEKNHNGLHSITA
jgi:hypothetical protein